MKRVVAAALVLAASSPASADRRRFAWTHEYPTLLEGQTSLELSHTQTRVTWDDDEDRLEQVFEVEHGITERWDAGLAFGFSQRGAPAEPPGEPYGFEQLRLETRYRFADRNEWPIDLAVLARGATYFSASTYTTEGRVIAARDMDALSVAVNAIGVVQFGSAIDTDVQLGWAAGVSYEVHPRLNLGVETNGARNLTNEKVTVGSVGPVIAFAPTGQFWVTLSAGVGFADGPDVAARLLVGIEL